MTVRSVRSYADIALGRQRSPANDSGPHMVAYLRAANVKDGELDLTDVKEMNFDPKEQQVFALRPGDVLVTEGSGSLTAVGASSVWQDEIGGTVCFQNTLLRLRPRSGTDPRFLAWWCRHAFADGLFASVATGANIFHLSAERLRGLPMRLFPLTGQRAIADYLDAETARIDALIAKKQQLIYLLEERVRALAVDLVAGHGGGVETGIRTIPLAPSHWRVLRNKVFMREVNQPSAGGAEEMLSVSHLTGVTPRSEKTVYMFEAETTVGYKLVEPGDLVINTMWAWMGAAGVSSVGGIVSPAYGVYRVDQSIAYPPWIDLLIRTEPYVVEMTRFSRGVTSSRLRLYPDDFLRLAAPVPPLDEQRELVNRYRVFGRAADQLIAQLAQQIELLAEHRQALITAAVTGEFAVPGAA